MELFYSFSHAPPHMEMFYSFSHAPPPPPGERLLFPPYVRRSWSPLILFRLFERVRNFVLQKLNKNKFFWLFYLTYLGKYS